MSRIKCQYSFTQGLFQWVSRNLTAHCLSHFRLMKIFLVPGEVRQMLDAFIIAYSQQTGEKWLILIYRNILHTPKLGICKIWD